MLRKLSLRSAFPNNIKPGEYFGREANSIIRKMQKRLIDKFEKEIKKYNRLDLHKKLLSIYSNTIHLINIHRIRYNSFENIDEQVLSEIQEKTKNQREDEKHNSRILQYLIESNIFLERNDGIIISTLEFLLAYSNWLLVLSDITDLCHFTEADSHIKINFEYVVDVYLDKEREDMFEKLLRRMYDFEDYTIIGDDVDKDYFGKAEQAFKADIGFGLLDLFEFFNFLQMGFMGYRYKKIGNNVLR